MAADPNCKPGPESLSETQIVSADRGLKNVFVYVKDGLGNAVYETPTTPVILDQVGCRYEPHVFGVFVNQPIEIKNSDPTLHNVHAIPKNNEEFNFGQQNEKAPVVHQDVRQARNRRVVPLRRARLDEVVRERRDAPLLCRDEGRRVVRDQGIAGREPTRSKRGTSGWARRRRRSRSPTEPPQPLRRSALNPRLDRRVHAQGSSCAWHPPSTVEERPP